MESPRVSARSLTGQSFEVADLLLIQAWGEFHDLRIVIELDYIAGGDEYEEVVSLYHRDRTFRRWMMWRTGDGLVVQPLLGRPLRFARVADALDALIPQRA